MAVVSHELSLRPLLSRRTALPFSTELREWVDDTISSFPEGAFARLGLCSFEQPNGSPSKLLGSEDVLAQLMRPGPRAASMAMQRRYADAPVWLFLREWRTIAPWSELRLFFRRGQFAGASQLHTSRCFPEIYTRADAIQALLRAAVVTLRSRLHLPSVVVDIALSDRESGLSWELVELNPFFPVASPGLFSWTPVPDFDGTFRWMDDRGRLRGVALGP